MSPSRVASVAAVAAVTLAACGRAPPPTAIQKEPERVVAPPEPPEVVVETPRAPAALAAQGDLLPRIPDECEPNEVRWCGSRLPAAWPNPHRPLVMRCVKTSAGNYVFSREDCATPLVLAFDGDAVAFSAPAGEFAIGPAARTEWVTARTPWLALDRDGSGCVEDERELFGPGADPSGRARSGFDVLAALDDDGDGWIDARDPAFARLVVWADRDQDRRCSAAEVTPLAALGVTALAVRAAPRPAHELAGSYEGETAPVSAVTGDGAPRRARLVDVYLAPLGRRDR